MAQNPGPELLAPTEPVDGNPSIEARLDALEARFFDLQQADAEVDLSRYLESGHDGSTMSIRGRVHVDLWGFPGDSPGVNGFETGDNDISPQDRIGFRRVRIGAQGDIWKNMEYRAETEFANGNDFEFRDVYLGFNELPILQTVLIGNQKRPYGLDHLNSSNNNVFIERPFVVEAFNQDARRLGIVAYGVSEDEAWNWQYGAFNQRLVQDEGNYISDHWQGQIAARLANTFWYDQVSDGRGYAHWAISGTWANTDQNADDDNFADSGVSEARFRTRPEARTEARWIDTGVIAGSDHYTLLGVEGVVNVGTVQVVGEFQNIWLDRQDSGQLYFPGGYMYVSYFLTGEHVPWNRDSGTIGRVEPLENFYLVDKVTDGTPAGIGAWQIAARYSVLDLSSDNIHGGIGESFTAAMNWHWNPWARMQLNYIYGTIHDNAENAVGGVDFGHYHIVGTRFMVDF